MQANLAKDYENPGDIRATFVTLAAIQLAIRVPRKDVGFLSPALSRHLAIGLGSLPSARTLFDRQTRDPSDSCAILHAMSETRKIAAILVADVVGYSRLAGADEDRTLSRLRGLRSDLIDPAIAAYHGRIAKRAGDGSPTVMKPAYEEQDAVLAAHDQFAGREARNVQFDFCGRPAFRRRNLSSTRSLARAIASPSGTLIVLRFRTTSLKSR